MTDRRNDNSDDKIMAAARQLSAGVTPERDLWAGIEAAIQAPGQSRWQGVFARAASVILLVGASSAVTYVAMDGGRPPIQEVVSGPSLKVVPANFGGDYPLGAEYENARAGLELRLEQELKKLPAKTGDDIRKNLAAIRSAIDDINVALAEEPDSVMLQKLLMNNYQRELELLARMDGFAIRGTQRNDI
jgi:hypothetical protein